MRRLLVGVAMATALMSTSAHAQNWTGFYIGANTGVGWGDASSINEPVDPASRIFFRSGFTDFAPGSFDTAFDQKGWIGGFQAGFNWQAGAFVWGVEADLQKSAISGSGSQRAFLNPSALGSSFGFDVNAQSELQWFGTVRGRIGFLMTPNLMLYGTGGLSYGEIESSGSVVLAPKGPSFVGVSTPSGTFACFATPANPTSICYAGSGKGVRIGWTAGLGGEWKLDANWSVKLEYLRVELQGTSINLVSPSPPSTSGVSSNFVFDDFAYNIVRVGLNYTFN
jgi:outer membrane immunogenic protein